MTKAKKFQAPHLTSTAFMGLWIGGHVGAWVLAVLVNRILTMFGIYIQSDFLLGLLMALGTGIPTAIVQVLLVERGLRRSMRGWLPISSFGWTLSGIAFYLTWLNIPLAQDLFNLTNGELLQRLLFLPFFLPVAIVQYAWLRRKVKQAWLWLVAAASGALLFGLPNSWALVTNSYDTLVMLSLLATAIAALLYSGVTGAIMLHLQTQPSAESASALAASDAQTVQLERLSATTDQAEPPPLAEQQRLQRQQS